MTEMFLESDALEVRRVAVELLLSGTLDAVRLLREQVALEQLDPKERRAAAIALLNFAGLGSGVPKNAEGPPRSTGVDHLLERINGTAHVWEGVNPFEDTMVDPAVKEARDDSLYRMWAQHVGLNPMGEYGPYGPYAGLSEEEIDDLRNASRNASKGGD